MPPRHLLRPTELGAASRAGVKGRRSTDGWRVGELRRVGGGQLSETNALGLDAHIAENSLKRCEAHRNHQAGVLLPRIFTCGLQEHVCLDGQSCYKLIVFQENKKQFFVLVGAITAPHFLSATRHSQAIYESLYSIIYVTRLQ